MTIELQMLAFSIALGFVQLLLHSHSASLQRGYRYALSPRDEPKPPLVGIAGRLERAFRNFLETFPMFAAAVLAAHAAAIHSARSAIGAQLYFWGRVAYVPLLVFGVPWLRSLVWSVASIGMLLVWSTLLIR